MPTQPAVLGTARVGNFRLGYVPASLVPLRRVSVRIVLAGADVQGRVRVGSLTIRDVVNDSPNSCAFALEGAAPAVAQAVRVTLGADPPVLLFSGTLQAVDLTYEGLPSQLVYACSAIDDTARATRRRPFGVWTGVSATTVAQALIASFAPGCTATHVQAALPAVSVIFDGSEGMAACLSQIATLIGGYWYIEDRDLHLFTAEASDAPDHVDASHPFMDSPPIAATVDVSQVRTRIYGRGHGEALLGDVGAGETILPIANAIMFSPTGGRAIALSQVLIYTGIQLGGLATLVGPGATPNAAPIAAQAAGAAGLVTGAYKYAYTFVTAAGESLPGPLALLSVGNAVAPAAAPLHAAAPTVGTGPDPGSHDYAITFVNASGETPAGPSMTAATTLTPAPASAPTPAAPTFGTGPDIGSHDYEVTFVTAVGETTVGPASSAVVTTQIASPAAPGMTGSNLFGSLSAGTYQWVQTFVTAVGETPGGPALVATFAAGAQVFLTLAIGPAGTTGRKLYRTVHDGAQLKFEATFLDNTTATFTSAGLDSGLGANMPALVALEYRSVALSAIPIGNAAVTSRKLYRRFNGAGTFKLLTTIANNTATTYADVTPNASLGAAAPSSSSAYAQRIALDTIPLGGATVTSRRIYRTAAGGAQLKLAATLADNTTTVWSDTVPDASLGANVPVVNTATANRVDLSALAVGPATVTGRNLYRTAVNGTQLKLLHAFADNTTTVYADVADDSGLGANAPTGDTSALSQPQGQVNAGAVALPTASPAPFSATGGWAIVGAQAVRYTGITGNTLTGIPATGPGALVNSARYGDRVQAPPELTGVSGVALPILSGAEVNIWVQRDDLAAQAAMALLDGGDGIYEFFVSDERRGDASLIARCDADLAQYGRPITTVRYATRDLKTKSGKPLVIDLASPPIHETLVIQDVTISEIGVAPGVAPLYAVAASTIRFSLDDLLRQLADALL